MLNLTMTACLANLGKGWGNLTGAMMRVDSSEEEDQWLQEAMCAIKTYTVEHDAIDYACLLYSSGG